MPHTPVIARTQSQDSLLTSTKCKTAPATVTVPTVTMMLAERMARSDWSIEDERFFDTNTMNVWQTIEFLSSVNLRKKYNYDGFSDAKNIVGSLQPAAWRRDSYVEKTGSPESDSAVEFKFPSGAVGGGDRNNSGSSDAANRKSTAYGQYVRFDKRKPSAARKQSAAVHPKQQQQQQGARSRSKKRLGVEVNAEYALSAADLEDLVKCSFTLPRITARLERLMGTNVVRLTDRNYMKLLRERIDDDHRDQLQKRIKARELKELERERILILEGKTDAIPDELSDDPIFMVNRDANIEIQKTRSKLKTNREKHAERLKSQSIKWERERQRHAIEEAIQIEKRREKRKQQKELIARYMDEDAHVGMDLLRIENDDWRECEMNLKLFRECERARMKERSMRTPVQFTSDPLDIRNIIEARQKFRETELRLRKELAAKCLKPYEAETVSPELLRQIMEQNAEYAAEEQEGEEESYMDDYERDRRKYDDDLSHYSASSEPPEETSTSSVARKRRISILQQELEDDVAAGLLISKTQFDHLRYEDEKIRALRAARDICELYRLAEEIILGDREIEEEEEEAAMEDEFDDQNDQ